MAKVEELRHEGLNDSRLEQRAATTRPLGRRRGGVGAYSILKPTTKDDESTVDGGGDNYTLTGRPKS